ncbi:hypothetical protein HN51_058575, partial [Arachis hypogaea]
MVGVAAVLRAAGLGKWYCKTSCNATGLISNTTLQPGYKSRINRCKKCGGVMK